MEHISDIIKQMAELGFPPASLLAIGMMYLLGAQNGAFPKFWGDEKQDVTQIAQQLLQHFNHDTTSFHEQTHAKLDKLANLEHETRDDIKDIKNSVRNIEKYGVPQRNT